MQIQRPPGAFKALNALFRQCTSPDQRRSYRGATQPASGAIWVGDHVLHRMLGVGTVVAVNGRTLAVDFYKIGRKSVLEGSVTSLESKDAPSWRTAMVTNSNVCRLGSGSVLLIKFEMAGSRLVAIETVTLKSRDDLAVKQGIQRVSEICLALGWKKLLVNSDDLHGLICLALVWRDQVLSYAAHPWGLR